MMKKTKGFTLTELLIGMSLSIFLAMLFMKNIVWQNKWFHQIEDQVFLDHQAVIAIIVLENQLKSAKKIEVSKDTIKADKVTFTLSQSRGKETSGLFLKNDKGSAEFIPNVKTLNAYWKDKHHLFIQLDLIAPYGKEENYSATVEGGHE